jgi:hypothetical protein
MLEEFERAWKATLVELERDLDAASTESAQAGLDAIKADHPYTDRTGDLTSTSHTEKNYALGGADMVWPEEYAGFVDGKRGFNFTKRASDVAKTELVAKVEQVAQGAGSKFGG